MGGPKPVYETRPVVIRNTRCTAAHEKVETLANLKPILRSSQQPDGVQSLVGTSTLFQLGAFGLRQLDP